MSSSGAVPTCRLAALRDSLKPQLPRSNSTRMCIRNVMEGRVQGNFYTDAWSHFTTVVFQCVEPRLSDTADLMCYSTSKHDLLHVLQQNQLVTEGKWQMIVIIEDDSNTITEYVMKHLQVDGQGLSLQNSLVVNLVLYGFLGEHNFPNERCPEGYFLGPLTEKDNQLASSQGQWFNDVGRPAEIVQEYHKQCIQRFDTVAAYHNDDPTTPVAWLIQWAYDGCMGNGFTQEAHRRKGLLLTLGIETCKRMLARGDIPQCYTRDINIRSTGLISKIGFSPIGKMRAVFVHWNPFFTSRL